jgi:uncharacterized protein
MNHICSTHDKLIKVTSDDMTFVCQLNNTRTAKALYKLASGYPPIRETGKVLGKELYFLIPLRAWFRFVPDFKKTATVQLGDVAYWPRGGYLTIYFGQLPGNPPGKIMPHAPVVVIGKVVKGFEQFELFKEYSMVEVSAIKENP